MKQIEETLKEDFQILIKWFYKDYMGVNSDRFHFMCLGKDMKNETISFDDTKKWYNKETTSGIFVDNDLRFKYHGKISI